MHSRSKSLVGLTIVAFVVGGLLVAWLIHGGAENANQSRLQAEGRPARGTELEGTPATGANGRSASRTIGDEASRGLAIRGRVLSTTGETVGGAHVSASNGVTFSANADGEFELAGLSAGEVWLRPAAPGMASHPSAPVRLNAEDVGGIELLLEPERALTGSVSDRAGAPVAGALVRGRVVQRSALPDWRFAGSSPIEETLEAETDAAGRFTLGALPAGLVELTVSRLGYAGFGRAYDTGSPELAVTLTELPCVFGSVVDADSGSPVPFESMNVLVSRRDMEGPWTPMDDPSAQAVRGDEVGSFRMWPRTNRPIRLVATGADFAPVSSEPFWLRREDEGPILLRAQAGLLVRGAVQGPDGLAVRSGAVVVDAELGNEGLAVPSSTRLDASGEFELRVSSAGACELVVQADGFVEHRETIEVAASSASRLTIELVLAAALEVQLKAPGPARLPELWARLRRSEASMATTIPDRRLDEPNVTYAAIPAGSYEFEVFDREPRKAHGRPALLVRSVELRPGETQSLALSPRGTGGVQGRLTVGGAAAPFRRISVRTSERVDVASCITDNAGRFAIQWLAPGSYALDVGLDPRTPVCHRQEFVVVADQTVDLDLALEEAELSGTIVVETDGVPVRGATIVVEGLEGLSERRFEIARVRSDAQGRFTVRDLASGRVLLSVEAEYLSRIEQHPVNLVGAVPIDVGELRLSPAGNLTVMLRRADGQRESARELTIDVLPEGQLDAQRTMHRKGLGAVRFKGLPPGKAEITVRAGDETLAARSAWVQAERHETVFVDLE